MKKIHAALIAGFGLLLAGSLAAGGLHLYGTQRTLPAGTSISGWEVGGLDIDEVQAGLQARLQTLEAASLTLKAGEQNRLTLTLKQAGVTYEARNTLQALQSLKDGPLLERVQARWRWTHHLKTGIHLDTTPLRTKLSPAWEQAAFGAPVDAVRRITGDDRILYTPGTSSYEVDWPGLELALQAVIPVRLDSPPALQTAHLELEIPLAVKPPDITLQSLKDQGVERKIVQFSTSLGASGPGRSFNVEAAAKAVDGTVLPPNAVFDYGKAIQKAQTETGFREAPVIVNGKLQPGTGGGICQVSSTLYNAALRTGLEIVERRNHSLPVSYLPKGLDATFAEGYINFRFRNNTGKYLVIKAGVSGRSLTVKLFGTFPENIRYSIESKTVKLLSPTDKYVSDPSLPRGGTRVLQQGKTGYVVESYITRYVDGKAGERKLLSRDTYYAQKRVIAINRGGMSKSAQPETPRRQLVEDGVKSR